jgi:hypothetical protein
LLDPALDLHHGRRADDGGDRHEAGGADEELPAGNDQAVAHFISPSDEALLDVEDVAQEADAAKSQRDKIDSPAAARIEPGRTISRASMDVPKLRS